MTVQAESERRAPSGVGFAVASAVLFGLSPPCSKLLLSSTPASAASLLLNLEGSETRAYSAVQLMGEWDAAHPVQCWFVDVVCVHALAEGPSGRIDNLHLGVAGADWAIDLSARGILDCSVIGLLISAFVRRPMLDPDEISGSNTTGNKQRGEPGTSTATRHRRLPSRRSYSRHASFIWTSPRRPARSGGARAATKSGPADPR